MVNYIVQVRFDKRELSFTALGKHLSQRITGIQPWLLCCSTEVDSYISIQPQVSMCGDRNWCDNEPYFQE
ncbi:hypothetical protein Y1Q_0018658 [Alligator mississippiensis]|uniref:Uncharacterized protein n=1 Tax=Alligator mississippiensis TaxID=8496 RepID=A0A151NSZ1_ALLMI|nr:hypothetical protein Y1Q_0018658 [Alligator mississippiensis]